MLGLTEENEAGKGCWESWQKGLRDDFTGKMVLVEGHQRRPRGEAWLVCLQNNKEARGAEQNEKEEG